MPGRILVVDDVATNRIVMKVRLSEAFYEVLQADSGEAALRLARREQPDLILLDVVMQDMSGIEVCRQLKADPKTARIPIIMITAARQHSQKLRALQAGAEDYLPKPLDNLTLLARVRNLLRANEMQQELSLRETTQRALGFHDAQADFKARARVALIAARREEALMWKNMLSTRVPFELFVSTKAQALMPDSVAGDADLYLISADLERSGSGLQLLSDLRARRSSRHAAIVIVTDETAREAAAMALDLGANDLVSVPFDAEEVSLRLMTQLRRKHQADRLRASVSDGLQMAMIDPLTGLFNRRYALPHLASLAERAAETRRPFAVMQLDLDRFKRVNDRYGHAAGDMVLEQVGRLLKSELRPVDMVSRVGGEEFLIALPETDLNNATAMAERLRQRINGTPVVLPGNGGALSVSASIGLALWSAPHETVPELLARADSALYAAKAEGRNKVTVCKSAA